MKILVPVDGSENSMRAVSYAVKLAKSHSNVEIILLSVACLYSYSDYYIGIDIDNNTLNEECKRKSAKILEEAEKVFTDQEVSVKTHLMQGDPADAIINYVEKNGIEKIIIGSRGQGLLKSVLLGSVTYKILHNVNIPVTVIK